jgi:hypothetical protein
MVVRACESVCVGIWCLDEDAMLPIIMATTITRQQRLSFLRYLVHKSSKKKSDFFHKDFEQKGTKQIFHVAEAWRTTNHWFWFCSVYVPYLTWWAPNLFETVWETIRQANLKVHGEDRSMMRWEICGWWIKETRGRVSQFEWEEFPRRKSVLRWRWMRREGGRGYWESQFCSAIIIGSLPRHTVLTRIISQHLHSRRRLLTRHHANAKSIITPTLPYFK